MNDLSKDPATLDCLNNYLALLNLGLKAKDEMLAEGRMSGTCLCPRCSGTVQIRVVGKRAHLRMACACGMSVME